MLLVFQNKSNAHTNVAHSMICGKDVSRFLVAIKLLHQLDDPFDAAVHQSDVLNVSSIKIVDERQGTSQTTKLNRILFRMRPVCMSVCIEAKQMKEKDNLVLLKSLLQRLIRTCISKQLLHTFKHPRIQNAAVCIALS